MVQVITEWPIMKLFNRTPWMCLILNFLKGNSGWLGAFQPIKAINLVIITEAACARALDPAVRFVLPDLELGTVFEEDNRDEEERGEEGRWVDLILVMDMINTPGRDIFFPLNGRISKIDVKIYLFPAWIIFAKKQETRYMPMSLQE